LHYDGYIKPVIENNSQIWKDLSKSQANGVMIGFDSNSGWNNNTIKFDGINDTINAKTSLKSNNFSIEIVFNKDIAALNTNKYSSIYNINQWGTTVLNPSIVFFLDQRNGNNLLERLLVPPTDTAPYIEKNLS
ncbi:MAG: hypothetical protein RSB72_00975, partial [Bacilli bacterium]